MNRCPICNSAKFEVEMFMGRYYTSCCGAELEAARENQ